MKKEYAQYVKAITLAIIITVFTAANAFAYKRVVVLYAAISPILVELGVGDKVVGVTRTDNIFTDAVKLGSHLKPNIELINALEPDLILTGSKRTFNEDMVTLTKAKIIYYDPATLDEIIQQITELGELFNKRTEAKKVVARLEDILKEVAPLTKKPTMVYEISAKPLRVAGSKSIITSIIEAAGGENIITVEKKHVLLSPEVILKSNPDYYIYQTGPMNKNPVPPEKREVFSILKSNIIHIDEYEFARPGINAFDAVLKLNKIFKGGSDE